MSTYEKAISLFKTQPTLWDKVREELFTCPDFHFEEPFDAMLEETLPRVIIGNYSYSPAVALERLDPVAYRQEFLAYIDSLPVVEIDGYYFDEEELIDFIEQHTNTEAI